MHENSKFSENCNFLAVPRGLASSPEHHRHGCSRVCVLRHKSICESGNFLAACILLLCGNCHLKASTFQCVVGVTGFPNSEKMSYP